MKTLIRQSFNVGFNKNARRLFAFLCLLAAAVSVASAANNDAWVGNTSPNWNTAANWNPGAVPSPGDLLFFGTAGNAGPNLTNDMTAGTSFNSITFNIGASAFTCSGNSIGITGGITNSSGNAQAITNAIVLGGNATLNGGSAGMYLGGAISGSFALTNNGSGVVSLGSINTFSGGVTINSGTLQVSGSGGKTALGYGAATTVNSGGTLVGTVADAFGYTANDSPGTIVINGGTVTDLGTANYSITLPNLTFTGGTLTSASGNAGSSGAEYSFNGNNTTMTINTVASSTTATISAGAITTQRQATFNLAAGSVTGGATPGVDLLVSSVLLPTSGHHGITKTGAGVLELTGANTFIYGVGINGGVVIAGGTQTGSSGPLGGVSNGNDVISFGGGTLEYSSANTYDYSPRFSTVASQAYSIDTAGQNVTLATALTSSGGTFTLTNSSGSGTLTLSGVNTYSGATKINGGALMVNGSLASGSAVSIGAGALGGSGTVNGPVTTTSAGAQINQEIYDVLSSTTATLTLGGSLNLSAGGTCYLDVSTSHLSGNDQVNVAGALTLGGNTFHINALGGAAALDATGDYVLLQAGSISGTPNSTPVWDGTPPSNSGSYIVTIAGANVVLRNVTPPGPVITSATATPSSANRLQSVVLGVTVSNGIPPYTVTVDTSSIGGSSVMLQTNGSIHIFTNTLSLAGVADGIYSLLATAYTNGVPTATAYIALTVTGVAMTWNGDTNGNSFWDTAGEPEWQGGPTYQQGDFVRFDDSAAGVAATNVNVLTTVTPGSIIVSNTAALPTGTYTFSGDSGQISGSASLLKQGTGTLLMQDGAFDNFTGGLVVSNGTLIMDQTADGIAGGLTIASGATAQIGTNDTGGTLPTGLVTDSGSLIFDRSDFVAVANVITGPGDLSEIGSGQLTLSGASTFTGNVAISNGTIALPNRVASDGSSSGLGSFTVAGRTVSIGPGATLSGSINNWFGSGGSVLDSNFPAMIVNGGTVTSTRYTALGDVTLNNGATLTQASTDPATYQGYQFRGNVTVGGSSLSIISNSVTSAADDLGSNTVFNVAVTSGAGPDLIVSTGLRNQSGDYGNAVGGFSKAGAGTMLIAAACTYTGNTVISNGVLALNGSGSISNTPNIVVGSAIFDVSGLSSPPFVLGSSQTLSNNASTAVINGSADVSAGTVSLTYTPGTPSLAVTNGTLTLASSNVFNLNNTGSALGAGNYLIISSAAAGNVGAVGGTAPLSVTVGGGGLVAGGAASLSLSGNELYLAVMTTGPGIFTNRTSITNFSLMNGTNLMVSGTNGQSGDAYYLLQSTNVALPFPQWNSVGTDVLSADGPYTITYTNVVTRGPRQFYILSNTNYNP